MEVSVKSAGLVSALVAVLLYLNTLDCDLVADDEPAIKWNADVRPSSPWKQLLLNDFWGTPLASSSSHKSYRPLCVATFRLNYMLHGLQPMGYHLVNVVLHAVVCYLYVQLCALVLKQVWVSLLAGLLFAAHPIHTEAVAGVVGRAELLSAILFLFAFHTYCRALSSAHRKWILVAESLGLSILAMLSKEQGVTALGLCLVYDFFNFNQKPCTEQSESKHLGSSPLKSEHSERTPGASKGFFTRALIVSASALVVIVTRLSIANGGPSKKIFTTSLNPPLGQAAPYRQLSWLHLVTVNLWLLLSPSKLSADWRYNAVPLVESWWDLNNVSTLLSLSVLLGLFVFSLLERERDGGKALLFGLCLMVFPFLPASNLLFPVGFVVAERVLYLPSMGFCMLVAYGLWTLYQRLSANQTLCIMLRVVTVCFLCIHASKTVARNRVWYSTASLQQAGVQFNPHNPILLSNLGIEHAIREDYSQAELLYLSSMRQTPSYSGAYYNYAMLMKIMQRYQEAEEPLIKSIQLSNEEGSNQTLAERYDLLVTVISKNRSRLQEALELSETVLSQHPSYHLILNTRCSLLIQLNRTDRFIRACEMAVWRNQRLVDAHYNLGIAYTKLGYLDQAEMAFRNLLVVAPGNRVGMHHLAQALEATGNTQQLLEARALWLKLLHDDSHNVEVLLHLATVNRRLHQHSHALNALDTVLSQDPDNKEALYASGHLLYERQLYKEALPRLKRLNELEPTGYRDSRQLLRFAQRALNTTTAKHSS